MLSLLRKALRNERPTSKGAFFSFWPWLSCWSRGLLGSLLHIPLWHTDVLITGKLRVLLRNGVLEQESPRMVVHRMEGVPLVSADDVVIEGQAQGLPAVVDAHQVLCGKSVHRRKVLPAHADVAHSTPHQRDCIQCLPLVGRELVEEVVGGDVVGLTHVPLQHGADRREPDSLVDLEAMLSDEPLFAGRFPLPVYQAHLALAEVFFPEGAVSGALLLAILAQVQEPLPVLHLALEQLERRDVRMGLSL
mmetsp:Transcript_12795/g.30031  ORF Transcript_12795/g.30031 Transcript_12795/m.30031 type:complete len:248 (+) Transcript_12795:270-1013(+)